MKRLNIILALALILLVLPLGSAFMPRTTHKQIQIDSLENPIDSQLYKDCMVYPKLCYSGNVLTDISVLYYYTEPDKYTATHSSSFFAKLYSNAKTPQEKACAVGNAIHLSSDMDSHNNMVPYAIKHSFLVNSIIHVFAEQKVDTQIANKYPQTKTLAINDLSDYEDCKDLFVRTMQGNPAYCDSNGGCMSKDQLDSLYGMFIAQITNSQATGYDEAFKTKSFFVDISSIPFLIRAVYYGVTLFFLLISILLILKIVRKQALKRHWIALFVFLPLFGLLAFFLYTTYTGTSFNYFINFISPISKLVPIGDGLGHVSNSITNTKNMLTGGEVWLNGKDADGFTELGIADASVQTMDYIIFGALIFLLLFYTYYLFKKNKIVTNGGFNF